MLKKKTYCAYVSKHNWNYKKQFIILIIPNQIWNIPSGFQMFTKSSIKKREINHDIYRAKNCIKKFCEYLR